MAPSAENADALETVSSTPVEPHADDSTALAEENVESDDYDSGDDEEADNDDDGDDDDDDDDDDDEGGNQNGGLTHLLLGDHTIGEVADVDDADDEDEAYVPESGVADPDDDVDDSAVLETEPNPAPAVVGSKRGRDVTENVEEAGEGSDPDAKRAKV